MVVWLSSAGAITEPNPITLLKPTTSTQARGYGTLVRPQTRLEGRMTPCSNGWGAGDVVGGHAGRGGASLSAPNEGRGGIPKDKHADLLDKWVF